MTLVLLFLLGFGIGALGTLIGVGGGFILVPVFLLLFSYTPQQAAGTSLAVVFLNALSGTIAYIRQRKVCYDAALRFSAATLPGAVIGSNLSRFFSGPSFQISFGLLLFGLALLLYYRPATQDESTSCQPQTLSYNRTRGICISILVGFFSSIFGIGGGIIHVPAMICLLRFPAHTATATSHFILAVSALFGVIAHYMLGNIIINTALAIGGASVLGAQLGAYLANKINTHVISTLLTLALALLSLRLILCNIHL